MNTPFYANGLHFSCTQCSACCRYDPGYVYLSEQDVSRLTVWSGLDRDSFINKWCRWVDRKDGYDYLCLLEKKNYDCILWDNGCLAYESRPLQCSSFPFWPSLLMDKDWWEANALDCPGVNTGELHTREEIEACLARRREEPYIRREKSH